MVSYVAEKVIHRGCGADRIVRRGPMCYGECCIVKSLFVKMIIIIACAADSWIRSIDRFFNWYFDISPCQRITYISVVDISLSKRSFSQRGLPLWNIIREVQICYHASSNLKSTFVATRWFLCNKSIMLVFSKAQQFRNVTNNCRSIFWYVEHVYDLRISWSKGYMVHAYDVLTFQCPFPTFNLCFETWYHIRIRILAVK